MKVDRAKATELLLASEGPELNLGGSEPGGASRYGISVDALTDYNRRHGKSAATVDSIRDMTAELAGQIYNEDFADLIRFDELPAGVDYVMLNNVANLGVRGGVRLAQAVLGDWQAPGLMDDHTVDLFKQVPQKVLISLLGAAWIAKKHDSPDWYPSHNTADGYGHGWTVRYMRVDNDAMAMVGV